MENINTPQKPSIRWQNKPVILWVAGIAGVVLVSSAVCWASSGFMNFNHWLSFLTITFLAAAILFGGLWLLRKETLPRWLVALVIGAALLRLFLGVVWFVALPIWGHGSETEKAGYIMADAGSRDQAAWKLAQSKHSLWSAFRNNRSVDQYGGLLFFSAFIYRYLGDGAHQSLWMVLITASVSALGVAFTWAFSRRAWDKHIAWIAAWIFALFPDAIIMGSSQMREAFTMTLGIAAFYGLILYQQEHNKISLLWLAIPLLLYLPFSPLFAALLLFMLALTAGFSAISRFQFRLGQPRLWLAIAGLGIFMLVGLWLVLRQFTPPGMNNPLEMLGWWLRKSAGLQAFLSQHASGWLQKTFKMIPEWAQIPLLVGYGVLQPFLPAAMVVGSRAPIWPWITAFRSIGWTILLVLLIYSPILAIRRKENGAYARVVSLVVWIGILIAALRGGGDMWDNPRYRTAFIGLQAGLAAWAWVEQRRTADPWLRRAGLGIAAILAWFVPWYARRYFDFNWPVPDLFPTIGAGVASAILLILWDWVRSRKRAQ